MCPMYFLTQNITLTVIYQHCSIQTRLEPDFRLELLEIRGILAFEIDLWGVYKVSEIIRNRSTTLFRVLIAPVIE